MKKIVKDLRGRLYKLLKELEEVSTDPQVRSIALTDSGWQESASSIIMAFIPRGELLIKKIDAIIAKLPKQKRGKRLVTVDVKPKKLSQRLLLLSKLTNPQELEVVWSSGRKQISSRTELAKILREIRKLERTKK